MANKNRLIKTFMDLVQIDSPTGEEDAMDQEVSKRPEALGFSVYHDSFKNVIANLSGIGDPIVLSAHLDTVEPGRGIKPILDGDILRSDGTTILGGDCKSGVTIVLEALETVIEAHQDHVPIEVAFSRAEEGGLVGARSMEMSRITAKRGMVFDAEGDANRITTGAPYQNVVKAHIHGRASHAGIEPEKGVSSILIAAEILTRLPLGRIDFETTANIGVVNGGIKRNIIPDYTFIDGELRSLNQSKFEYYTDQFRDIFTQVLQSHDGCSIDLDIENTYAGYMVDRENETDQMIAKAVTEAGLIPKFEYTGGGSDANIFFKNGITALPVGIGVTGFHTTSETADIEQVLLAAEVCERVITTL